MGEMRDSTAVNPLIQALGDADTIVRAEAARALGRIGDIEAGQRLIHMMNDEAPDVREAAVEALARLGAPPKMERASRGLSMTRTCRCASRSSDFSTTGKALRSGNDDL